jgi:hypothetical protein
MEETEYNWLCPWCGRLAELPVQFPVICASRRCECGALGLGARTRDSDEIIDDAIGIFGIADGYMTPFDSDRIIGLQQNGVEVAESEDFAPRDGGSLRVLWFRKPGYLQ